MIITITIQTIKILSFVLNSSSFSSISHLVFIHFTLKFKFKQQFLLLFYLFVAFHSFLVSNFVMLIKKLTSDLAHTFHFISSVLNAPKFNLIPPLPNPLTRPPSAPPSLFHSSSSIFFFLSAFVC